jgi:hypothetical protein
LADASAGLLVSHPDSTRIEFAKLSLKCRSLDVFRAHQEGVFPSVPRIVATTAKGDLKLGGFASVQLVGFSAMLRSKRDCKALTLRDRAELFALLADPNGASTVIFLTERDSTVAGRHRIAEWSRQRSGVAIADTIVQLEGGQSLVRLSLISRKDYSNVRSWDPLTYAFIFDSSSELVDWSVTKWPEMLLRE